MEQLLKPSKRAQKAADGPPQQNADQDEKAQHIVGELELRGTNYRLERPDRAGACGDWTGVAAQAGDIDSLQPTPGYLPMQKIHQKGIRGQCSPELDLPAVFVSSQCPHVENGVRLSTPQAKTQHQQSGCQAADGRFPHNQPMGTMEAAPSAPPPVWIPGPGSSPQRRRQTRVDLLHPRWNTRQRGRSRSHTRRRYWEFLCPPPYRSCRRWPLLIYQLVGKALAPLDGLTRQIRERTAEDLARPLELPDSGDEVAELARAFNPMSWRLNQAFVLQKNFSHKAAHEFRAPLAILKARIGLFRKKQDFQPQATLKFLGILESEADRLSAVVGSLLELTNLERMDRSETFTAAELLQTVSEELIPQAEARQVTLVVNVSSGSLVGNRELLHRAVFNLAENAVKYGPEGGIVNIVARHRDDWIRISVEDQGPRIPEYLRQRIFEPFFRVDAARSRQQGGAGLGLALVRAIAEAHGGLAYVRESGMGGNCFVLELPYPGGRVTSPP